MKSFTGIADDSTYEAIIATYQYLRDSQQIVMSLEEFVGVLAGLGLKTGGVIEE